MQQRQELPVIVKSEKAVSIDDDSTELLTSEIGMARYDELGSRDSADSPSASPRFPTRVLERQGRDRRLKFFPHLGHLAVHLHPSVCCPDPEFHMMFFSKQFLVIVGGEGGIRTRQDSLDSASYRF
jgi:hypothetical protein